MTLQERIPQYLTAIETELKQVVSSIDGGRYHHLHTMVAYHMGWEGQGAGPQARGKRIRPLLVLLSAEAAGGNWESALPAAVSVEIIHNFSLIHDDIEDNSPLRRGRCTLWQIWGVPQAINTGDLLFSLAHAALLALEKTTSALVTFRALQVLEGACLQLTKGQFLDIYYEHQNNLLLDDYWAMINGKTAALIAACTELGALVAGVDEDLLAHYRAFGLNLGLAFQTLDDSLGVWGEPEKIGKSTTSDLVKGKKTLPVLFGIDKGMEFAERWKLGPILPEEVPELAALLEEEGARTYTQEMADRFTSSALEALDKARPTREGREALKQLASQLLKREV